MRAAFWDLLTSMDDRQSLKAFRKWQKGFKSLVSWKERNGLSWHRAIKSQILRPMILPFWLNYQNILNPKTKLHYSFPAKTSSSRWD